MNTLINSSCNYKVNFAAAIMDGLLLYITLALLFGLVLHIEYLGF